MGSSIVLTDPEVKERERAELAAVLECEGFRRSPQMSRLLSYLCEKYFEGRASEIKEYRIAVDVLGRGVGFDPQIDAIVRVDAYHVRKRLKQYYAAEGADHEIQLVLPSGQYTPKFVWRSEADTASSVETLPAVIAEPLPEPLTQVTTDLAPTALPATSQSPPWRMPLMTAAVILALIAGVSTIVAILAGNVFHRATPPVTAPPATVAPVEAASAAGPVSASALLSDDDAGAVRIMAGSAKQNYTDKAGRIWLTDRYFTGGTPFRRGAEILRTQDPELYKNGREGAFAYRIPLAPGGYDLRLYFAETSARGEALRWTNFAINGTQSATVDIASDAGGINTATTKIFKSVAPASDGNLTLTFQGNRDSPSFLNAIEILPIHGAADAAAVMHPIRLTTALHPFKDHAGHLWLPDGVAAGGRVSTRSASISGTTDPELYQQQRFGHFTYSIPVVEGGKYTVVLHFAETWFGTSNAPGGAGSRVFDVYCNGTTLLKAFDIYKEGGSNHVVTKTFHGVLASPQGKVNLEFSPRTNYALVNSVEIIEE